MPYVLPEMRQEQDGIVSSLKESIKTSQYANENQIEGMLNYIITSILADPIVWSTPDLKYRHYNRIMGVLESVKQEIYRRAVSVYEDKAMVENGDILVFRTKEAK